MNYSDEHKYIILTPPRQGTRTLNSIFVPLGFGNDMKIGRAFTHRLSIPSGKEDYKIISTIRNPYNRYLSVYRWQSQFQSDGLHEYTMVQLQDYDRLMNIDRQVGIDYWIDTECIREGLLNIPLVQENLDVLQPIIDDLDKNPYKREGKLEAKMTQELADEIYSKFKFIFERFKYDKNSWK